MTKIKTTTTMTMEMKITAEDKDEDKNDVNNEGTRKLVWLTQRVSEYE